MNPPISQGRSHPRRAIKNCRWPRLGFTLVELLVVIAIIGMLVALLLPAIQRARESGRRVTCTNNQHQIGTAFINYVSAKDKYPPGFNVHPVTPGFSVGWVPQMLPYLEQQPLYQVVQATAVPMLPDATVSVLICPSRSATGSPAPLSYVVNAGRTDSYTPVAGTPMDWQANGVFFDWFTQVGSPPQRVTMDSTFISRHDGNSMTLLFSENLDALDWILLAPPADPTRAPPQLVNALDSTSKITYTWWQGIVWLFPQPYPVHSGLLNKNAGNMSAYTDASSAAPPLGDAELAKPSSSHPGGFNVTMCDGHAQFLSEEIEYRVYTLLLSPDSAGAKEPGLTTLTPYPIPSMPPLATDWTITVSGALKPLTGADLEK